MAKYTRLVTKHHAIAVSLTTTGFLSQRAATSRTALTVSSLVSRVVMISARRMTTGGDAQCQPITRSGRSVDAASAAIGKPEVFEARMVVGGAARSRSRN